MVIIHSIKLIIEVVIRAIIEFIIKVMTSQKNSIIKQAITTIV